MRTVQKKRIVWKQKKNNRRKPKNRQMGILIVMSLAMMMMTMTKNYTTRKAHEGKSENSLSSWLI